MLKNKEKPNKIGSSNEPKDSNKTNWKQKNNTTIKMLVKKSLVNTEKLSIINKLLKIIVSSKVIMKI